MKSMKQEKQQEIALMRYGAIAPIIAGLDERYPSKTAFYTEISAKGLMGPDGKLHLLSGTIILLLNSYFQSLLDTCLQTLPMPSHPSLS